MFKKVLQLVKYYDPYKGGVESVVKNIVEGIVDNSNEYNFTIFSNNHKFSLKKKILRVKDNILVIKVPTLLFFKSQPINIFFFKLNKLIKENDVIHYHYPNPLMELKLYRNLKLIENKKLIVTWHANIGNSRWGWIESFYNIISMRILKRADSIIITSPQLLSNSKILKKFENKIRVIPLTFNPIFFTNEHRKYPTNKKIELLFVGKLRDYKGLDYLIHSIIELDVFLNIVGNGENYKTLVELVRKLDLKEKVKFHSQVDNDLLLNFYKKSDIFILPSINEAEAFGVVQLEALASGLPVINTNIKSGVPYVSLHEITGLTVDPKNIIQLKQAIEKLIKNKNLYESYSLNAIKRAQLFSIDKMTWDYLSHF